MLGLGHRGQLPPFQRQVGGLADRLQSAVDAEYGTTDTDLTFQAIDETGTTLGHAYVLKASPDARNDIMEAADLIGSARDVIATNWSMEPPHIDVTYGDIGRDAVRKGIDLLRQAVAEA